MTNPLSAQSDLFFNIELKNGVLIKKKYSALDSIYFTKDTVDYINAQFTSSELISEKTNDIDSIYFTNEDYNLFISGEKLVDIDGNIYKTIIYNNGMQWMAQNLAVSKLNDGTPIPYLHSNNSSLYIGTYGYLDNNIINNKIYGKLYEGSVVNTNKICPVGWHVPSEIEWKIFIDYLKSSKQNYFSLTENSRVTDKLNSKGKHWKESTIVASNTSGFSTLPGGYLMDTVSSKNDLSLAFFWTSTKESDRFKYLNLVYNSDNSEIRYSNNFYLKSSIRCLKGDLEAKTVLPKTLTNNVYDVTTNSAFLKGYTVDDGTSKIIERGFVYSENHNPTIQDKIVKDTFGLGSYIRYISNLKENQKYYVKSYAKNYSGIYYGNEIEFTTKQKDSNYVYDINSNKYNVVRIGTQKWIGKNLETTHYRDGRKLNYFSCNTSDEWSNTVFQKNGCFTIMKNTTMYNTPYGYLYDGKVTKTDDICPNNWHLPNTLEVKTLNEYLGNNEVAINKLKEPNLDYWKYIPNVTNSSGFSARGGGYINGGCSARLYEKEQALWAMTNDSLFYIPQNISNAISVVKRYNNYTESIGLSVRCISDDSYSIYSAPSISLDSVVIGSKYANLYVDIQSDGNSKLTKFETIVSETPITLDSYTVNFYSGNKSVIWNEGKKNILHPKVLEPKQTYYFVTFAENYFGYTFSNVIKITLK